MKRNIIAIALLMVLPGCVTGPRHTAITTPHQSQFTHQSSMPIHELEQWWKGFNDQQLTSYINQALEHNYSLSAALHAVEQARQVYYQRTGDLLPEVGGLAAAIKTRFSRDNPLRALSRQRGANQNFLLGFDAYWEVDLWGRVRHEVERDYYRYQAEFERMRNSGISLIAEVARAYVMLCSLKRQQALLSTIVQIDEKVIAYYRDRVTAGIDSRDTLELQQQSYQTSNVALESARINYQQARHALAVLTGQAPGTFLGESADTVPKGPEIPATGLPSELLQRRPDVRMAEYDVAAAIEDSGAAVAEWFPKLTLFGLLGTGSIHAGNLFDSGSLSALLFPVIQWPILNYGKIKANINAKQEAHAAAVDTYCQAVLDAFKDVEDFSVAYYMARNQTEFLTKAAQARHEISVLATDRSGAGIGTDIDALMADKNDLMAYLALVQSEEIQALQLIGLYKALGGGW